jgi:trimeric autotransporter adhesin
MSNVIWRGDAQAVAQVDTITVTGTWAANDTATLTINGKDLVLTVGTDVTVTDIADALKEMINGDTQSGTGDHVFSDTGPNVLEFAEIEASAATGVLTITGRTAGMPFTITRSETTAGTGALGAVTSVTAATGPNHWSNAENWVGGAVPVNSDDVWFIDNAVPVLYGLGQSAVTLASLNIDQSYTGTIGLPRTNASGYFEYRETYLAIGATLLNIGRGEGAGSGRIKIDLGSVQSTVKIDDAGNPLDDGLEAVLLKGTNASNSIGVSKGSLGVAVFPGETAVVATLRVGYRENVSGDSEVRCGVGVTLTTITQSGGLLTIQSNVTTVNITDGELDVLAGTVTTYNIDGGAVRHSSAGTITTANVGSGGQLDFRRDLRGRTITNCNLYAGFDFQDPNKTVTFTNGIDFLRCGVADGTLNIGEHQTLTPSAI